MRRVRDNWRRRTARLTPGWAILTAKRLVLRPLLIGLLVVLRPRRHVVVFGLPDLEGNAVEVLRWLVEHGHQRVYWLTQSGRRETVDWALPDGDPERRVHVVRKSSWAGIALFLTARYVFYSHQMYFSLPPRGGRVFVNLWHGDGPKLSDAERPISAVDSYMVSGTRAWGTRKARARSLSESRLLVVGNPRIDQLTRPASDAALQRLGIRPDVPFLLWAPTYRHAGVPGRVYWRDNAKLSANEGLASVWRSVLSDEGVGGRLQAVAKPHPLDIDDYTVYGMPVVTYDSLADAQVGLYQLLARASAVVTDYSSIWTDYLPLGRPIGLYCPDFDTYMSSRLMDREEFEHFRPGPLLHDAAALTSFCREVAEGHDVDGEQRRLVIERLGAVLDPGAADRLMRALRFPERLPRAR